VRQLKIVMISSEGVPFAKSGGLADVVGALPRALRDLGHNVIVILPRYTHANGHMRDLRPFLEKMGVWMGDTEEWCAVQTTVTNGVPFYFIESNKYFDRYALYHDADFNDYQDNPRRFGFFTRAALQLCRDMRFVPDIVHVHDWQTALAPAYLKIWHHDDPILRKAASVLTIHNIAYQGVYNAAHYNYLGLGWENFTPDKFEDHRQINFLKGGIYYADVVNTVSPTYAQETLHPGFAHGLAPYLNNKGDHYLGILNGVDYDLWNPAVDQLIPARYTPHDMSGKAICKQELQRRCLLQVDPDVPLIGVVSRLVHQKGLDMLAWAIERIVNDMRVQFVILGTGDKSLEWFYGNLPGRYPGRIGSYIGYNDELAHWIEAGSDFFLMPSFFEPCGLNQIYALKYGTLPIVRATGGLQDTVQQYDEATGNGTGFKFWEPDPYALYNTVGWVVSTYYDRKHHMRQMVHAAMAQDFSWNKSAKLYVEAYERAILNKILA